MIDVASRGALIDKTSATTHLISNMASNTQQFRTGGTIAPRMVNEVGTIDNLRLENQLTELTSLVRQLAIGQHQPMATVKACGICTSIEHPTNMCPTLQEIESSHLQKCWINRWPPVREAAICKPAFKPEHVSKPRQLSTVESKIPGAIVPTIVVAENTSTSKPVSNKQPGVSADHELY
ncbi:hypothetical protein CR513_53107, partial [Mucuna pruriens]